MSLLSSPRGLDAEAGSLVIAAIFHYSGLSPTRRIDFGTGLVTDGVDGTTGRARVNDFVVVVVLGIAPRAIVGLYMTQMLTHSTPSHLTFFSLPTCFTRV